MPLAILGCRQSKMLRCLLKRIPDSNALVRHITTFIYRPPFCFAQRHPFVTIAAGVIAAFLCLSGMTRYKTEDDPLKLWLPLGTDFTRHSEFLADVFDEEERWMSVVIIAEEGNVMSAENLV